MSIGATTEDVIQIIDGEYVPSTTYKNDVNVLPDVTYCRATGELNGNTTLQMRYPIGGINYEKIAPNKILMVKVNKFMQTQPMRILSVTKSLSGANLEIKAEHLTNDLRNFVTLPNMFYFTQNPLPAYQIGQSYMDEYSFPAHVRMGANPDPTGKLRPFPFVFDADADVTIPNPQPTQPKQLRMTLLEFLGGKEGSLLDMFGGEYIRDRHKITLKKRVGSDKGFRVEYGLNMTDLDMTVDLSNTLYGVAGFIQYQRTGNQGQTLEYAAYSVTETGSLVHADPVVKGNANSNLWNATGIEWLDVGSYAKKEIIENGDLQTINAECRRVTEQYVKDNPERFQPNINLKVNFVDLSNKTGYEEFEQLKELELGDDVTIQHKDFGIDVKTRFISYEFDFLADEYTKLELGQPKSTFLTQLRSANDTLYYKAFNLQNLKPAQ